MEKRFKVVIIDNVTSEVKTELDTDCLIAGISLGGDESANVSVGHCDAKTIGKTIASAMIAIKKAVRHDPAAGLFAKMLMDANTEDESGGDDDE